MDKKTLHKMKKSDLINLVLEQDKIINTLETNVKDYELTVQDIKITYQDLKKEYLKMKENRVNKSYDNVTLNKLNYLEKRYKETGDKSYINKRDKVMAKY